MSIKILNMKKNDEPLATDEECKTRRSILIAMGVIKPISKSDLIEKKDGTIILSTKKDGRIIRKNLISQGIIDPTLCQLSPDKSYYKGTEEGQFVPRPIKFEEEYDRRKRAYFRIMQEILRSRTELKLVLGKKNDSDPEWYF
jgi:hypothetical protein